MEVDENVEENAARERLQAMINKPRYDFNVVARFLCQLFNVSDPAFIVPFGTRKSAWEVMRPVTLGVEVGSVVPFIKKEAAADNEPAIFQFNMEPENEPEQQATACVLDPATGWCRFLNNPQPTDPFKHPITEEPMLVDLDRVCIYSITVRHVLSSVPISVAARMNYYHTGLNALQKIEQQDQLFKEAGGIKGAFLAIAPTSKEGLDVSCAPMPQLNFGYTSESFTATMALVNDQNLMNGIVELPHEVCLEAGLPVYRGTPEPSDALLERMLDRMTLTGGAEEKAEKKATMIKTLKEEWEQKTEGKARVKTIFMIPINHVLGWGLASEDYTRQMGIGVEHFRFKAPNAAEPVVLYFMVTDYVFHSLVAEFKRAFMNKVDIRPLSQVAFEFVPMLDRSRYPNIPLDTQAVQGFLRLRAYLKYMAAPRLTEATIRELAPALALDFPSCHDWSEDDVAKQMAVDSYLHGGGETMQ